MSELTHEQRKTLASILWGEKGMATPKGSTSYLVFADDNIPGLSELVTAGYLKTRENPAGVGSKLAYALTNKGRIAAKRIKIAPALEKSEPNWRKADVPGEWNK